MNKKVWLVIVVTVLMAIVVAMWFSIPARLHYRVRL